jgi:hypothetical protein
MAMAKVLSVFDVFDTEEEALANFKAPVLKLKEPQALVA